MATPSKHPPTLRSTNSEILKASENFNPNIPVSPPHSLHKQNKAPAIRSAQSKKAADKTPGRFATPPPQQERATKFIIASGTDDVLDLGVRYPEAGKEVRKMKPELGSGREKSLINAFESLLSIAKCRKEAYEALQALQEEFFIGQSSSAAHGVAAPAAGEAFGLMDRAQEHGTSGTDDVLDLGVRYMPELGSGREKSLINVFESLLSIAKCRKEGYEALQALQAEFFRGKSSSAAHGVAAPAAGEAFGLMDGTSGTDDALDMGVQYLEASLEAWKMNEQTCMPERGSGRVKSVVNAFKSLLSIEKCLKEAYEALQALEFFRGKPSSAAHGVAVPAAGEAFGLMDGTKEHGTSGTDDVLDLGVQYPEAGSEVRKMKKQTCMPELGSGPVKSMVNAFESLLSISKDDETENSETRNLNAAVEASSASVFSSSEFFPSRKLANDLGRYTSIDSNSEKLSWGNRTSGGGGRNKRNSSESLRRSWNTMHKVTSQQPFKLRTEQRGRIKEEKFIKKVKEMLAEEKKQRIPIAQGLPWTTHEPEHLVKPPVKKSTKPIDVVLHSDVRAVKRAEFDQFVAERMKFAEKLRRKREMQQMLEKEEMRQLRRELVPKARPLPYFRSGLCR